MLPFFGSLFECSHFFWSALTFSGVLSLFLECSHFVSLHDFNRTVCLAMIVHMLPMSWSVKLWWGAVV